jgi:type IV pilus assembly protein PilA
MDVIIFGILAAIAIPVFLAQRNSAREAAAQSDLRNSAAAATGCASANQGSSAACDEATLTATYDCNQTAGVSTRTMEGLRRKRPGSDLERILLSYGL